MDDKKRDFYRQGKTYTEASNADYDEFIEKEYEKVPFSFKRLVHDLLDKLKIFIYFVIGFFAIVLILYIFSKIGAFFILY